MVALAEFEDKIEGLDFLCQHALDEPEHAGLRTHLVGHLAPDMTPLKVPTGLGNEMDELVTAAAARADAVVRHAGRWSAAFERAVVALRHELFAIAGEIVRLKELA